VHKLAKVILKPVIKGMIRHPFFIGWCWRVSSYCKKLLYKAIVKTDDDFFSHVNVVLVIQIKALLFYA